MKQFLIVIFLLAFSCGESDSNNIEAKAIDDTEKESSPIPIQDEQPNEEPTPSQPETEEEIVYSVAPLSIENIDQRFIDHGELQWAYAYFRHTEKESSFYETCRDCQFFGKTLFLEFEIHENQPGGLYNLSSLQFKFIDGSEYLFWPGPGDYFYSVRGEPKQATSMIAPSIIVENVQGDFEAPRVIDFFTDKTVYCRGEMIEFTIKLAEKDESGIRHTIVNFKPLDDGNISFSHQSGYNSADGLLMIKYIQIPEDIKLGFYKLCQLEVYDLVGNKYQGSRDDPKKHGNTLIKIID